MRPHLRPSFSAAFFPNEEKEAFFCEELPESGGEAGGWICAWGRKVPERVPRGHF